MKILILLVILDIFIKLIEYIYYKKHNWENDIGYQMFKINRGNYNE